MFRLAYENDDRKLASLQLVHGSCPCLLQVVDVGIGIGGLVSGVVDLDRRDVPAFVIEARADPAHRPDLTVVDALRIIVAELHDTVADRERAFAEFHREAIRSEEHTSELQSQMRISYAVFCLKKKNTNITK